MRLPTTARRGDDRRRRRLRGRAGRGLRRRGRERQRQDDLGARADAAVARRRAHAAARRVYDGHDLLALAPRALRGVRGDELAMVFQDPLTSLHPMLSIGQQLTEHVRSHEGASRAGRASARGRAARRGAHPRPGARAARLPAPVLRRDAAADRDRDRARLPAEAADRRRADDRARRDRAGGDPAPARPAAPRERALGDPDHARPRRDVVDRRPACRSSTPAASSSRARRARCSTAPRHPYTRALLDALPHPGGAGERELRRDPGRAADARAPSGRLRVPSALRRTRGASLPRPRCRRSSPIADGRLLACHVDPLRRAA